MNQKFMSKNISHNQSANQSRGLSQTLSPIYLSPDEIRLKLKSLVKEEKKLLVQILDLLKTIEESEAFLRWGFGSMFDYCTSELGYSEGAAQRRILAMRLLKKIPETREVITDGRLSLSVAAQVQNFFKEEDKYRKLVNQPLLEVQQKREVINSLLNLSSRDTERKLCEYASFPIEIRERTKPVSATHTLIQFVADESLLNDIEKLKSITSHTNSDRRYDLLFRKIVDIALEKLDPDRQLARRIARKNAQVQEMH
jgi:hypothetical protein